MAQTPNRRKKFKHLSAEVSNDFYAEVAREAQKQHMTKSDFIRMSLRRALSRAGNHE